MIRSQLSGFRGRNNPRTCLLIMDAPAAPSDGSLLDQRSPTDGPDGAHDRPAGARR